MTAVSLYLLASDVPAGEVQVEHVVIPGGTLRTVRCASRAQLQAVALHEQRFGVPGERR